MKVTFCLLMLCGLLLAIAPVAAQDDTYWPDELWRTSTPEAQGIDSALLAPLLNRFQPNLDSLHSLLVIRHGYLVLDASNAPFHSDMAHWQFSATKSVISTLVGIAVDQGLIEGVDQSIWDFFATEGVDNWDDRKAAITIADLLTQSSGLGMIFDDEMAYYALTADEQPWVDFILDQPMGTEPGTVFNYLDANAHLLSAILTEATGMSAFDYAQINLFAPLGITEAVWRADPQGVNLGGDGLSISPYSMAKLGYLYLNDGVWNGQSIISAEWVAAATQEHIRAPGAEGYGYLWWTFTAPEYLGSQAMFAASGLGGQMIWVVPDSDLVVVLTGDSGYLSYSALPGQVLPAVVSDDPLPENPDALAALQAQVAELAEHEPSTVRPIPEALLVYSGQSYALEANELGWESLSVTIGDAAGVLSVTRGDERFDIPFGLDRVDRVSSALLPSDSLWLPIGSFWRPTGTAPLAASGHLVGDERIDVRAWDLSGGLNWSLSVTLGETAEIAIAPSQELTIELETVRIEGAMQ